MRKIIKRKLYCIAVLFLGLTACTDDLNIQPYVEITPEVVFSDFENYKMVLAKLYAGYAVSGQTGPAGQPDISGLDEGFSNYLRLYWGAQELPTDEAVIAWNDGSLPDYSDMDWTPANEFIRAMYNRIFYQISLCNEFIRETSDEQLSSRGITGDNLQQAKIFRAEARALRALSYWHALDMFGNVTFVTEEHSVGNFLPEQISREALFDYLETELLEMESEVVDARLNEYGRVDRAFVWTLLAKLYLNAEVYTGTARYNDVITYTEKVINAGFSLEPVYGHLFLADNHLSPEIIFPITSDGTRTTAYGGMTFLVSAPIGGDMDPQDFGVRGGWAGLRTTSAIVNLFPDPNGDADSRGTFFTSGQELEINNVFNFTDGYPFIKFKNVTSTGQKGSDPREEFPDTDFPMFRLADVYLMYAEAVLRGGANGNSATALQYVNALRERAYGDNSGNITAGQLTLDFILDERGRELNWEAHRRTDLIRFGKFTSGNYLWPWKGGVKEGREVGAHRTLFPIPTTERDANPNLEQNTGYTQ